MGLRLACSGRALPAGKDAAAKEVGEQMKDDHCIFCRIANGEIPARTLYEDERFRVILDNGPATRGHALILPKEHYADIYELPDDLAADAMVLARKMAGRMHEKLHCDGFNIVQNNGTVAGQTVFHFHIHLIPRYKGDGQTIGWQPGSPSAEELDQTLQDILAE